MNALRPLRDNCTAQPNAKKRRTQLSLEVKINLLERLKKGDSINTLASEYNIHPDSIRRIKRNGAQIHNFKSFCQNKDRRRMTEPKLKELDEIVHSWYLQQKAQGIPMTDAILSEKARKTNEDLQGDPTFMASHGWVAKFKRRHDIGHLSHQEEKPSADEDAACVFIGELEEILEDFDLDDVYNMAESGLCWQSLPSRTLANAGEKRVDGAKSRKDRVTIATCANATGTHRLPLLVVGKYPKPPPCCQETITTVPAVYRSQKNARMTSSDFTNWVRKCFKPAVELRQLQEGRTGRVMLLLHDCAAHKLAGETKDIDDKITIAYLPSNTTSLIQPMDQGVIIKLKRLYQKKLMRKVLECPLGASQFIKKFYLRDCVKMAAESWSEMTNSNLRNAWRKLLPTLLPFSEADEDGVVNVERDTSELADMLGITNTEVSEWLNELQEEEERVVLPLPLGDSDEPLEPQDDSESDSEEDVDFYFRKVLKWSRKHPDFITQSVKILYDYFSKQQGPKNSV